MNLLEAMADEKLFAPWFKGPSWDAWKVFLKALFALPMGNADLGIYSKCTGRSTLQHADGQAREAWLVIGRRGGKSFITALTAVYLAAFRDYRPHLAVGEIGTVMILAADRKQSRTIMRYVKGLIENIPMLSSMVERITTDSIDLNNSVSIEIHTSNYRSVRGYTILAAICDELAYWRSDEDSSSPDTETIAALRPALSTIPNSLLICLSSPYSRRGSLWTAYKRHYGQDGDILVWQAPTRTMNPTVPQRIIDDAMTEDPARASSEYLAQFRSDLESFVSREVVDSCVIPSRYELPPIPGTVYKGFTDPSGGSADSFTLAIGHMEGDVAVLDAIRETKPPFSPDSVCRGYAALLQSYDLHEVSGDKYAGGWPSERFQRYGISYRAAEKPKSDLYAALLPLLNGGRAELLDNSKLINQLCSLERRTARSGKDSIDHCPGSHDDIANSVAGVLTSARGPVNFSADMYELEDDELTDFNQAALCTDDYRGYFE